MASPNVNRGGLSAARLTVAGSGEATVATGLPVLDHLLALLVEHASFDVVLEVAPGDANT